MKVSKYEKINDELIFNKEGRCKRCNTHVILNADDIKSLGRIPEYSQHYWICPTCRYTNKVLMYSNNKERKICEQAGTIAIGFVILMVTIILLISLCIGAKEQSFNRNAKYVIRTIDSDGVLIYYTNDYKYIEDKIIFEDYEGNEVILWNTSNVQIINKEEME